MPGEHAVEIARTFPVGVMQKTKTVYIQTTVDTQKVSCNVGET
jgi:hypothetical protein